MNPSETLQTYQQSMFWMGMEVRLLIDLKNEVEGLKLNPIK